MVYISLILSASVKGFFEFGVLLTSVKKSDWS